METRLKRARLRRFLVPVLAALAAVPLLGSAPASATTPGISWGGYGINSVCLEPGYTACLQIEVQGRLVSDPYDYDSTAGWGRVAADDSGRVVRVQIDEVVLGTQYGVLTTSTALNSGTSRPPLAALQGPPHRWGQLCGTGYHVAVYWSARLSDGSLRTGKLLGPWYSSFRCS
jgi:hypothetical protein